MTSKRSWYILLFLLSLLSNSHSYDYRQHPNWPTEFADICGDRISSRIVGGRNAEPGQFPWMAVLRTEIYNPLKNIKEESIFCGGALNTDQYVISAAHCAFDKEIRIEITKVTLGEWDISQEVNDENGVNIETQAIPVEKIFVANFNASNLENDMISIKLRWKAEFNDFVSPICLPSGYEDPISSSATIAGWGYTNEFLTERSSILQYAKIQTLPMKECKEQFPRVLYGMKQISAGSENIDSCQGDSGGPLMQIMEDDRGPRYYLTGIVSCGETFCGDAPAIYTRVIYYLDFTLMSLAQ